MSRTIENIPQELKIDRSDWELVKFGDVALQQKESVDRENTSLTKYIKGEHMNSEDLHIREWGDLEDEYLGPAFIRKFEKGDILYGSRRTYLRKVAIAPFEGITSNTTFVIKANEEKINKDLLPFIMLSEGFADHSIKNSKGSVNPYVNWKDLANYEFLLPPKDQQAQIAELLWAMDEVVEGGNSCILKADTFFHSWLNANINSKKGWKKKKLSSIAFLQRGVQKNKSASLKKDKIELPYLRVANVQDGYLDLSEIKTIIINAKDKERYLLKEGDLLLTEGGDFDKLGRGYIWQNEIPECIHQNHVYAIRTNKDEISPWFLSLVTRSNYGKQYFLRCAKKTSNLATINSSQINEFKVLTPSLDLQKKLVKQYKEIEKTHEKAVDNLNKSKSLQKSLINQIF